MFRLSRSHLQTIWTYCFWPIVSTYEMLARYEIPCFSYNCLNITRRGSKTCSTCRKILMLLSIEGYQWRNFVHRATLEICITAKCKPAKREGWAQRAKLFIKVSAENLVSSDFLNKAQGPRYTVENVPLVHMLQTVQCWMGSMILND
jgi:hypothetical protein